MTSVYSKAYVLLDDGAWFSGITRRSFGASTGEVVFTTNMSGYQEVFTDPSFCGQIVTMTAPMIGNYGVNDEDLESETPRISGVIVRELAKTSSNWRATRTLEEWLTEWRIPLIEGVDTRQLTRHIRSAGAKRGILATGETPTDEVRALLDASPSMEGLDLASQVSRSDELEIGDANAKFHVVAFDFGIKTNILRILSSLDCRVTLVPANTSADRVKELEPDGVFLSNGPGDPAAVEYAIPVIRTLADSGLPTFGICLGHQLLSLAFGAETVKLPYGHRGGNHPVREMASGRVLITSQNHGFAVRGTSKVVSGVKVLEVTHRNLNDDTVEGVRHVELPAFGVQYHPEACPGPHDARDHFTEFVQALDSQQVSRY